MKEDFIEELVRRAKDGDMAACLNKALQLANNEGFKWLLTMDQDSRFMTDRVPEYLSCLFKVDENVF